MEGDVGKGYSAVGEGLLRGCSGCSPPFYGYCGWPGARTCLKPGLSSLEQVSHVIAFCFFVRGEGIHMHSVGKTVQWILIKQVNNLKALIKPSSPECLVPPLLFSSESLSLLVLHLCFVLLGRSALYCLESLGQTVSALVYKM